MSETVCKHIEFFFHPSSNERCQNPAFVEKQEGNQKHKYLYGISSGIKTDLHGERMTNECILDFINQSQKGEVLLYADKHDFKSTEDIGKLTNAKITPTGDWFTEYRLYDESDGIGEIKLEKINNLWKQIAGLPPYKQPRQKGFSIEGLIPDDGIISYQTDEKGEIFNRVINKVSLDGVVVVPRPAYDTSIANAIFKALDETPPWVKEKIKKNIEGKLSSIISNSEKSGQYFTKKIEIEEAFETVVNEIMTDVKPNKQERLEIVFDEYKKLMIDLIMQSSNIFQSKDNEETAKLQEVGLAKSKVKALKDLQDAVLKLHNYVKRSVK